MPLAVTFRVLDDDGEDHAIGRVVWDGEAATADPPGHRFLADWATTVAAQPDPAAALRELPRMYRTAYRRAELTEDAAVESRLALEVVAPAFASAVLVDDVDTVTVTEGYTGRITDKLGRSRCYQNGRPVECHKAPDDSAHADRRRRARDVLADPSKATKADLAALADALKGMTVAEIRALQKTFMGRFGSQVKPERVNALVAWAKGQAGAARGDGPAERAPGADVLPGGDAPLGELDTPTLKARHDVLVQRVDDLKRQLIAANNAGRKRDAADLMDATRRATNERQSAEYELYGVPGGVNEPRRGGRPDVGAAAVDPQVNKSAADLPEPPETKISTVADDLSDYVRQKIDPSFADHAGAIADAMRRQAAMPPDALDSHLAAAARSARRAKGITPDVIEDVAAALNRLRGHETDRSDRRARLDAAAQREADIQRAAVDPAAAATPAQKDYADAYHRLKAHVEGGGEIQFANPVSGKVERWTVGTFAFDPQTGVIRIPQSLRSRKMVTLPPSQVVQMASMLPRRPEDKPPPPEVLKDYPALAPAPAPADAGGGSSGPGGLIPPADPAALGPRAVRSLQTWRDESKPLADRIDRLADLDTTVFDPLHRAGLLTTQNGFAGNNEVFRHLLGTLKDWDGSDRSAGARRMADQQLQTHEKKAGEYAAALRGLADRGVTFTDHGAAVGPDQLRAAADLYAAEAPKAVAAVRAHMDAPPPAATAPGAVELAKRLDADEVRRYGRYARGNMPDMAFVVARGAARRLGLPVEDVAAAMAHAARGTR
jgi:hypothetical protein